MARKSKQQGRGNSNFVPPPSTTVAAAAAAPQKQKDKRATIVFFHPDLGIGGAERLVVDAAVGLSQRGHQVVIFTNHCDPNHCFDECRDGTLDVRVRASSPIPMSIFNRLTILCAILRHIQLLLTIIITGELSGLNPTALIVDQLSAGLPLLRHFCPRAPLLFYCHFPDLLLARRSTSLKRLYRLPFDALEEWSMGFAQSVCVNSEFTRRVVVDTWPRLAEKVSLFRVVYPCVDTQTKAPVSPPVSEEVLFGGDAIMLSINRFERKKDIGLAIRAFAAIPTSQRQNVRLVIAGGYDHRIEENVSYHQSLQALATSLSLDHSTLQPGDPLTSSSQLIFLPSVANATKEAILSSTRLLIYTPSSEHFGIVPLEAMRARTPVLAATTGGPVETVVDGVTGWLRDTNDEAAWTDVMVRALTMPEAELTRMGKLGAKRVAELFSRDKMAVRLEIVLRDMLQTPPKPSSMIVAVIVNVVLIAATFIGGLISTRMYYFAKQFSVYV